MRLDKYLKVSRLIKRRSVAKEVCDGGKVSVNGKTAKAGTEVKVGDVLEIGFGPRRH
jgi:ribosomal 50S subunit-recycling heat shock protein